MHVGVAMATAPASNIFWPAEPADPGIISSEADCSGEETGN